MTDQRIDRLLEKLYIMAEIANVLSLPDSDRPTILEKLNSIEAKINQLLERDNGDTAQS